MIGFMDDILDSSRCSQKLKALADPDRLRIVQFLRSGSHNVTQIAEGLALEIAKASHHLGVLRHSNLVHAEKQGRFVAYTLNPEFFITTTDDESPSRIDLGCCRIELP